MADAIAWTYLGGLALVALVAFRDAPWRLWAAHREGRVTADRVYHAANVLSVLVLGAWLAALAWGIDRTLVPSSAPRTVVRLVGLVAALAGFGFMVAARVVLAGAFAPTAARPPEGRVIARGPYALVRHPFYLGLLVALAGGVLALDSLATLAALLLTVPLVRTIAVREEAQLADALGEAYAAYRERVPRWLPTPWHASER